MGRGIGSMVCAVALLSLQGTAQADVTDFLAETEAFRSIRSSGPPSIPASAYTAAEAGSPQAGTAVVPGHAARKGWGVAILDHPVETVWKSINDELSFPELTQVSHSILLEGRAGHARRLVFHYLPLSFVEDRWWVTRVDHNARLFAASGQRLWEMTWSDDFDAADPSSDQRLRDLTSEGQPVAFTRGAWLASALDEDRTLLEYHSHADPGGALPAGAISRFAAGSIIGTIEAVDTLCDQRSGRREGGFVRPDGSPLP